MILDCDQMDKASRFECNPNDKGFCIDKIFKNDGFINCPPPHCADEGKCKFKSSKTHANPNAATYNRSADMIIQISALVIMFGRSVGNF